MGIIHALVFSPNRYWLCAATSSAVKVWDLETKELVETLEVPVDTSGKGGNQYCISLAGARTDPTYTRATPTTSFACGTSTFKRHAARRLPINCRRKAWFWVHVI